MGAGVAGAAKEQRVAEREQAHVSDQEIEGAGEEREAERLHREDGVDEPGRGRDHQDQDGDGNSLRDGPRLDPLQCDVGHVCFPNRPAGRTSRTMAMTTKMTVLEASG